MALFYQKIQAQIPNIIQADRVIGVHVSPTVFFNVRSPMPAIVREILTSNPGSRRAWHQ